MRTMNISFAIAILVSWINVYATNTTPPPTPKPDPTVNNGFGGYATSGAEANAKAYSHGGTGNGYGGAGGLGGQGGVGGQGGTIAPGAVQNSFRGGDTRVSGIGNTNFNNPRQTPPAYAPLPYATADCIKTATGGGSGGSFGFSFGFGMDSRPCNGRSDAITYQQLGLPSVGCQRMMVGDYEEAELNRKALAAAGITCNEAKNIAVSVPVAGYVPSDTPTLDSVMPPHSHPEYDEKIHNAFEKSVGK